MLKPSEQHRHRDATSSSSLAHNRHSRSSSKHRDKENMEPSNSSVHDELVDTLFKKLEQEKSKREMLERRHNKKPAAPALKHGPEYYTSERVHGFLKALCREQQVDDPFIDTVMYKYENGTFASPNGYLYDVRRKVGTKLQKGWFCAVVVLPHSPFDEFDYQNEKSDCPYLEDCVQECYAVTGVDSVLVTNHTDWLLVQYEGIESGINNAHFNLFKHERKVKFVGVSETASSSVKEKDHHHQQQQHHSSDDEVGAGGAEGYDPTKGYRALQSKDRYRPVIKASRVSITSASNWHTKELSYEKIWKWVCQAHKRKLRNRAPRVFKA